MPRWCRFLVLTLAAVVATGGLVPLAPLGAQQLPPRSEDIARRAIAAFDAGENAELERLARMDPPGAWPLADALLLLGRGDVALALAKVSGDEAVDALVKLVEKEKDLPLDTKARKAVEAANGAFARRDLEGVLAALEGVKGRALAGMWVMNGRNVALRFLERWEEAVPNYFEMADHAKSMGWLWMEGRALLRACQCAQAAGNQAAYRDAMQRRLSVEETRGDKVEAAAIAIDLGIALSGTGDPDRIADLYRKGIELAREAGHDAFLANGLTNLAAHLLAAGDPEECEAMLLEARKLHERVGNRAYVARAIAQLAEVQLRKGRRDGALKLLREAVAIQEKVGDDAGRSATLLRLAHVLSFAGDASAALEAARESLALSESSSDPRAVPVARLGIARILSGTGQREEARELMLETLDTLGTDIVFTNLRVNVLLELGSNAVHLGLFGEALERAGTALRLLPKSTPPGLEARVRTVYGNALVRSGETEAGLEHLRAALEGLSTLGPSVDQAQAIANVGFAHIVRGEFAPAIERTLAACALYRELGERRLAAETMINLGAVYGEIGDIERATEVLEEGLREMEKAAGPAARAAGAINLGAMLMHAEESDSARRWFEKGRALARESGERLWELNAEANLALVAVQVADEEAAHAHFRAAHALAKDLGGRREIATLLGHWSEACGQFGDAENALSRAHEAVKVAEECADARVLASAHHALAYALISAERASEAVSHMRIASESAARMAQGVPATTGGHAGTFFDGLIWMAMRVAADGAPLADVFELTERARAGQLLEGLGGRQALRESTVPSELLEAERRARLAVVDRRAELDRSLAAGELKPVRAAREQLAAAEDAYREVVVRVQITTRAGAAVFPQPVSLEAVQKGLAPDQVLVSYFVPEPEAFAIVVTNDGARLVSLGDPDVVEAAAEALRDQASFDVDVLSRLRKLLVEPLGLPAGCKRLLVVPQGATGMVPFSALVGDRTVALVPSATAHALLSRDPAKPGSSVLALGDPAYGGEATGPVALRGAALSPLPATRDEVKAIGDVVLLGEKATESGFSEALGQKTRWRAVHFACHGLVDEEKPLRSALAVTPGDGEDGFLSVLDVHRMRVPADLVVLSACESARGRVSYSQGVIGFTGAFLLAGSDRVVASLWKVDDKATAALMKRFYELWKGGATAADALRGAQQHIRSRKEWEHPRFWAAWQLWGRPD